MDALLNHYAYALTGVFFGCVGFSLVVTGCAAYFVKRKDLAVILWTAGACFDLIGVLAFILHHTGVQYYLH